MKFLESSAYQIIVVFLLTVQNVSVLAAKAHISKFIAGPESVLLICDDQQKSQNASSNATAATVDYPKGDRIRVVEFRYCAFDEHPYHVLRDFHGLSAVYLASNRIPAINGSAFSGSPMLSYADLSNNQIRKVSAADLVGLEHLRHLNLQGNFIEHIPSRTFAALVDLEVLNLSGNKIEALGEAMFNETNRLIELNLSHNFIGTLAAKSMANLNELRTLDLSYSALESIEGGAFAAMPELKKLDLSQNFLREIESNWQQPELTALRLNNNLLPELSDAFLERFPRLKSLKIGQNQFKCSFLKDFLQLANATDVAIDVELTDIDETSCIWDADMLIAARADLSESVASTTVIPIMEEIKEMRSEGANDFLEIPLKEIDEEVNEDTDEDDGALTRTVVVWTAFLVILLVLALVTYIVLKRSKKEKKPEQSDDTESSS